jgi:chaperonin cofactor prefoldin
LGERYTEKNIKSQLYGEVKTAHVPMPAKVTLLIDIENSVKAKQSAGLKEWMEMKNLKMAAMTMNYLSDNNLWYYKDLSGKHDELKNRRDSSLKQIKQIEKRIKELNAQIKDLDTFRKNKPVVEKLDSVVFKEKYKRENETAFILFNAAKQSLNAHFPNKKYPLIKTLRAELSELYAEKQKLYPEYYEAKDEYKTISTYKQNLETITSRTPQEIEREERLRNKSKDELE